MSSVRFVAFYVVLAVVAAFQSATHSRLDYSALRQACLVRVEKTR